MSHETHIPGFPENSENGGTTVPGAKTDPSVITAQSEIMHR